MSAELDSPKTGLVNASTSNGRVRRRSVLVGAAAVVGGSVASSVMSPPALASAAPAAPSVQGTGDTVVARAGTATVEIESGKITGAIFRGIYAFKGIPYGADTGGSNRFQPAKKPVPWAGIRSSCQYGFVCPQGKDMGKRNDEQGFMFQNNDRIEEEDCLRINVWTPGIADNKKRPVMVWLHGGGFTVGSGHDIPCFDGENIARRGDVVLVTLNHRLNFLGFMDLSRYSEKYALSGNVGMLDIVTALEWVRDNISVFGGDPSRVLIFGQSGGGAKVTTLMGMPAAKGLFHRAVVQSGSFALSNSPTQSQKLTDLVVAELGLNASSIDKLHSLPYADIYRASEAVLARVNPHVDLAFMFARKGQFLNFGPLIDGNVIPASPLSDKAPAVSVDVPMIVGTTLNEFVNGMNHPEFDLMTEEELLAKTEEIYPGKAEKVIAAFRQRTPTAKPADLFSRIAAAPIRKGAIKQAAAKAALNKAPAYLYWFQWQTPIFDGRPRAFHCAELPFVFFNTDKMEAMTGGGPVAMALAEKMTDAWVQFARTGDPNHVGIPAWPQYSPKTAASMIWDNNVEVALDPDGRELSSIA